VKLAVRRAEPVRDMLQDLVIDGDKVKVALIKRLWESLELAVKVGLTVVVTDMPHVVVCVTLGVGVGVRLPGEATSVRDVSVSEGLSVWVQVNDLVVVLRGVQVMDPEKVAERVKEGVWED